MRALGSTDCASTITDVQQVKGLTFDTAARYFNENFGAARWEALLAALPPDTAELIRTAQINEWYPESELRKLIHQIYQQIAERDAERFLEIVRGLALTGISRFFRVVINFASGRFVLRKLPVFWRRLRRGPATLTTEIDDAGRVLIHYDDFVYCHDPIYRLLSIGNCQALVVAATKQVPKAEILAHDRISMTLAFTLDDEG